MQYKVRHISRDIIPNDLKNKQNISHKTILKIKNYFEKITKNMKLILHFIIAQM